MLSHVGAVAEGLSTLGARHPQVLPLVLAGQVSPQPVRGGEPPRALRARVAVNATVPQHVLVQRLRGGEVAVTFWARVRSGL
jgi:hypothetical protein